MLHPTADLCGGWRPWLAVASLRLLLFAVVRRVFPLQPVGKHASMQLPAGVAD
eukprot:m.318105 g.318105  ORF g.318105 m.318105 type:complete len:53 (+) comp23084_c1_seq7:281-439(+)